MTGFNDGLVTVYRVENQAAPGDKPVERLVRKVVLRYRRRTVGIQRHYAALNAGAKVDLLLRVPFHRSVSAQDVAVPTADGRQYRITLVQAPEDVTEKYVAEIDIYANNRNGLLADITKALTEKNISILSLNTRVSRQGLATMQTSFEVESREELNRVIEKIRSIESVVDIERATG